MAQLGVRYAFLVRWYELWHTALDTGTAWPLEEKLDDAHARFVEIKEEGNVTRLSDQDARDSFYTVEQRLGRNPAPPPTGCENLSRVRWTDLLDSGFRINQERARKLETVDDPDAADGKAALLPLDPQQRMTFTIGHRVPLIAAAKGQPLRVKLSVRVDATADGGVAFECGIHNIATGEDVATRKIMVDDVKSGSCETIDLGSHTLSGWRYLWLRPATDAANVQQVLVDRAWLVLEGS